ncbi:hypothetical protein V3C99_017760 [Haemonchus contortus]
MIIHGVVFCIFSATALPTIPIKLNDVDNGNLLLPFGIIGDMDSQSRQGNVWHSPMVIGTLALTADRKSAAVEWLSSFNYTSVLNYGNRGMELSDLIYFNGKLMSVDDKTGIVYRIDGRRVIPWVILSDENGTDPTPFKGEWLTSKDGFLYCGSNGKERTTPMGEFINDSPMYVKRISKDGVVESQNWVQRFISLRAAIEILFPGYVIHEAVQWSKVHKRWFFLPRHKSKLAYNVNTVEETGANVLLSANENFTNFNAVMIGHEVLTKEFSAFQFVPGTNDTVIVAIKSQELAQLPFASFIMVFTIHGRIILDETRIPGEIKYEGISFLTEEYLKSLYN